MKKAAPVSAENRRLDPCLGRGSGEGRPEQIRINDPSGARWTNLLCAVAVNCNYSSTTKHVSSCFCKSATEMRDSRPVMSR